MRSARPFDNPGAHFTYQVQGQYGENGHNLSPRGAALASWTNDTWGTTDANVDLNDPNAGWTWTGGRVNIQGEKRDTSVKGAQPDVKIGKDELNARVGAAFDDVQRTIIGLDNSAAWQQAVCGGNGTYNPPPAA